MLNILVLSFGASSVFHAKRENLVINVKHKFLFVCNRFHLNMHLLTPNFDYH